MPDPSRSRLRANLDALAAAGVPIDTAGPVTDAVRVEGDPDGLTVSVRMAGHRWVRLHSGRDPHAEADAHLAALLGDAEPELVIVVGLGLGYILEAVERRADRTRVLAFEPLPATLEPWLARRDWRDWIASGRLTLVPGPDYPGASSAWTLLPEPSDSPPIFVHPVLERAIPVEVARARALVDGAVAGARANADARRRFAGIYLLNTLENLPVVCSEGDVASLFGAFAGVPGVVVAAGPSLDQRLADLRTIADRVLIVAVDTAMRPLLAAGIHPHVVVAVDPQPANASHLQDVPDASQTWFVAEGSLDPSVFAQFAGRTFAFSVSDHPPWPWLSGHAITRGRLAAWGSVLTTAFDLACRAGCDPIAFLGADLAFTRGLLYCRNTIYEADWAAWPGDAERADAFREGLEQRPTCMQPDVHGSPVLTSPQFVQFRDWLVARAREATPCRVVNATGHGILHGPGVVQDDLRSMVEGGVGRSSAPRTLAAAWQRDSAHRRRASEAFARVMAEGGDVAGVPIESWLAFAGETARADQIGERLASAAARLARPLT